ncbi:addiction module protein [candidate division KSB1 bacterium]|nr:addiction module protein [candidate division KSB1 bacterium]MBL7092583.1 addiction module protein [candidate division KSB1 bacterium]
MEKAVEKILTQALQTKPKDRAFIAERLISSLDTEADLNVEIAWQNEISNRIKEVDNGIVDCLPWEVVRERLRRNSVVTG